MMDKYQVELRVSMRRVDSNGQYMHGGSETGIETRGMVEAGTFMQACKVLAEFAEIMEKYQKSETVPSS